MTQAPTQYLLSGNVIVNIESVTGGKVSTDEGIIPITKEVQMKVINGDKIYWVECYYLGDPDCDYNSDTYTIRVYNNYEGLKNSTDNKYEIAGMCIYSDGSSICDEGLYLEDTKVEDAIMSILFGNPELGIEAYIKPF